MEFYDNMRGSGEYRKHLAEVYVRRLMEQLTGRKSKMEIQFTLNGKLVRAEVGADTLLLDLLRGKGLLQRQERL